ncbi:hypothetical protein QSH18_04205 [Xanthomonas sp. NCPPB 2654]|uniref:hypothetical protein n=1 Tax=unclassified Xanthomonas TaxID=2643310 RepID=UPI0021E0D194|nr:MULTISPECIES: hypothetical protein [unclassified Xanthomonas]MDL5364797.1 hypothetical protein [Xanthomonas sp. NCPPB 2654]UYC22882.1 hypothetical protein NUG20_11465 [Xanthomonas sp. CFBP 8443]
MALRLAGFVLGALWTLPNTLLGLTAGLAAMLVGARARVSRRELALVFDRFPWGPRGALTLGNVILVSADDLDVACATYEHAAGRCRHPNVRLGDHERAHVLQYLVLGPLFLPVYFACGGVHVRNPLERAADRYAMLGRGWWPGRR